MEIIVFHNIPIFMEIFILGFKKTKQIKKTHFWEEEKLDTYEMSLVEVTKETIMVKK